MKKSILIVDVARCHGCNNCFMACKDEFVGNDYLPHSIAQPRHGHRWIDVKKRERGVYPMVDVAYLPLTCQQCGNAPCMKSGKGAVHNNSYGVVELNPLTSKDNHNITESCPYKAIYWNEENNTPQKCNMCVHLLEKAWKKPRCVMACPTGALEFAFVKEEQLEEFKVKNSLEVLHPEYNTNPHVFYKNLYKYTKHFAGGSITFNKQCLENVKIICSSKEKSGAIAATKSNSFGDFKIDGLDSGEYSLYIKSPGRKSVTVSFTIIDSSIYIGVIELL